MQYTTLGGSGIRVSEICLGTMTFGEDWHWGTDEQESARILGVYRDAGGNFLDTANLYTNGSSEEIIGRLTTQDRDRWVIATKCGLSTDPTDPNAGGGHRKTLRRHVEASLRRLNTDYIDLYQLHALDKHTPIDEWLHAVDDLVRAGKILTAGLSNTAAWLTSTAASTDEGRRHLVSIQDPYSLIQRDLERAHLDMAAYHGLTVLTWEPLGAGLLTGRYGSDQALPAGTRITYPGYRETKFTTANLKIADSVNEVAAARSAPAAQVALAWVLAQRARANVVPIIGARDHTQLGETLGAVDLALTDDELAHLDKASRIDLGHPHTYGAQDLVYGDTGPTTRPTRCPVGAATPT